MDGTQKQFRVPPLDFKEIVNGNLRAVLRFLVAPQRRVRTATTLTQPLFKFATNDTFSSQ